MGKCELCEMPNASGWRVCHFHLQRIHLEELAEGGNGLTESYQEEFY